MDLSSQASIRAFVEVFRWANFHRLPVSFETLACRTLARPQRWRL
jgi:hypothetical protein